MFLRRIAAATSPHSRRFFTSSNNTRDLSSSIAELNEEMESVFGEPPPTGFGDSVNLMAEKSQLASQNLNQEHSGLTHVGSGGEAQMVDVTPKGTTMRTAIASCKVLLGKKVFDMVSANEISKGDVLTVAKIAGINASKQTSTLIPLCHNIPLTHVRVDLTLDPDDFSVGIEGEARTTGKTGVEMEAMTAVTVAGLTIYDMCKAVSKEIQIDAVKLEHKTGGKSGNWFREK